MAAMRSVTTMSVLSILSSGDLTAYSNSLYLVNLCNGFTNRSASFSRPHAFCDSHHCTPAYRNLYSLQSQRTESTSAQISAHLVIIPCICQPDGKIEEKTQINGKWSSPLWKFWTVRFQPFSAWYIRGRLPASGSTPCTARISCQTEYRSCTQRDNKNESDDFSIKIGCLLIYWILLLL